tara:strand:+ start:462 stop:1010 length:549 start_codon:yes stop_codon:yes gene_type:complete
MTPKEIQILSQACQMAGIDSSKISPSNPFEKSGGTASLLQAAVAAVDPAQAAKWRVAAGGGLSIATLAELESGQQLSEKAQKDLWEHDAAFVVDYQKQQQESEAAMFKQLEDGAAETRLRNKMRENGGNEAKAREEIARQDAADQERQLHKQQSAKHAAEMQQRIEQKRQNDARMAGVFING